MKKRKISLLVCIAVVATTLLSGCNLLDKALGDLNEALKGRSAEIRTFDEDSNVIDRIKGKSISIQPSEKFSITDAEGNVVEKSSVLNITLGGEEMLHVGSSLILAQEGLVDQFDAYAKTTDIEDNDRSVPVLNRIVNNFKNATTGKEQVLLIRSQSGKPLATYVGNDISYFATDIDKSTSFLIDDKLLFVYRCDFTIYPLSKFK